MPYSLRIERLGLNGCPTGPVTLRSAVSESEAIKAMRAAIEERRAGPGPFQFSIFDPEDRMLWCYSSEAKPALRLELVASSENS